MPRPGTPDELRKAWQRYFVSKGHTAYPSAPLVPANDPTLLFTGAGMNQFKDMFLGKGSHPFKRASTVQKCVRAGDIDNVGKTLRHFTFFEMLGNFSFDDYFKQEAIEWGWEFSTQVLELPPERITVTIYKDDDESYGEWRKKGLPDARIRRFSAKANYWPQNAPEDGPNGPCGPCTEMYYDFGPGTERGDAGPDDLDSGRYLEFWNLVFPQYDRQGKNDLRPLGRRNVDTGAGFERMLAVMEGKNAPFHTAAMFPIVLAAAKACRTGYRGEGGTDALVRRVADHVRTATMCVADGIKPSNEGRGYVLRRILRRAIRDGIGAFRLEQPFLHEIVPAVVATMKDGYPDLVAGQAEVVAVVRAEEEQFRTTYAKGIRFFEEELPRFRASGRVPGDVAFKLHDTYGFPIDLLTQIAEEEHRLSVDRAGFDVALEGQRERARASSKMAGDVFATGPLGEIKAKGGRPTKFLGYEGGGCEGEGAIVGLVRGSASVEEATAGDDVSVVLDQSPFYAEGGGQVGDTGVLEGTRAGGAVRVMVRTTQAKEGLSLHVGRVESGTLRVGDRVHAKVDRARRDAIRRNHTATHLLHEALKRVLGAHVRQQGSLVADDRLRFDFAHGKPLAPEELRRIEDSINGWILDNADVGTSVMGTEAAKASGAVALFGENYGDEVRVVAVPGVSRELCGGTHVRRAGDIGTFRVTSEASVASGVRRIEAVTGHAAVAAANADRDRLREIASLLKAPPDQIVPRITALQDEMRDVKKQQEKAAAEAGARLGETLAAKATPVAGRRVLVAQAPGLDGKGLKTLYEGLAKAGVEVAFLVGESADKVPTLAGAVAGSGVDARTVLAAASALLGGGGGGRPELAQGSGLHRAKIGDALGAARAAIAKALGA